MKSRIPLELLCDVWEIYPPPSPPNSWELNGRFIASGGQSLSSSVLVNRDTARDRMCERIREYMSPTEARDAARRVQRSEGTPERRIAG